MLDERLLTAASLYVPCEWGADVGSDHAYLPCYLLRQGVCGRMIVSDVSPRALERAKENIAVRGLTDRTVLALADGLDAIDRPCGCISVMGMGGETMSRILLGGADRLQGAALVLSAHTEQHLVRQALMQIGYRIVQERLCQAGGRFYIFWQAMPGMQELSEQDLRHGKLLWQEDPCMLKEYCRWRIRVLGGMLTGLRSAATPDEAAVRTAEADTAFYRQQLDKLEELP